MNKDNFRIGIYIILKTIIFNKIKQLENNFYWFKKII